MSPIFGHSGVPMNARGNIDLSRAVQREIKDTINECLQLLVEVFMKVMNGLVMTFEEDEIFMCFAAPLCEQFCRFANEGAKLSIKLLLHELFFFLSVFSSSEVLAKITAIRSRLLTAACWSRGKKRGNFEANLPSSVPRTPRTNLSQCSSPIEALKLIVESKSQPV